MKRIFISIVVCLLTYTGALALIRPADPTYAQLADQFCPAEWATLNAFDPPLYLQHYHDQKAAREPGTSLATNAILHRPFIGALAIADFVGHFVSLDDAKNHTPYTISQTQARLDFVTCLDPSEESRQLTLDTYKVVYPVEAYGPPTTIAHLFAETDKMFCMGFDTAFDAIKDLDPSSATYKQDVEATHAETMKNCDAPRSPTQPTD